MKASEESLHIVSALGSPCDGDREDELGGLCLPRDDELERDHHGALLAQHLDVATISAEWWAIQTSHSIRITNKPKLTRSRDPVRGKTTKRTSKQPQLCFRQQVAHLRAER